MTEKLDTTQGTEMPTFGRGELPKAGAYSLDLSAVAMIPLKVNGHTSTFAEVYRKLQNAKRLTLRDFLLCGLSRTVEVFPTKCAL